MHGSRTLTLALAVLIALALLAPAAGQACASRERSCCAGMPSELAALCQRAQSEGLRVPGCCDHEAPAPQPVGNDAASQALAAPVPAADAVDATALADVAAPRSADPGHGYSRTGLQHDVGLFTLHAVFLI